MSQNILPQKHGLSAMAKLGHDAIAFVRDLRLYSDKDDKESAAELKRTAIIDAFLNEMNDDDEQDWLEDAA